MNKYFHFFDILSEAITITILVMVMMLIIEWINVKTRGSWANLLNKNKYLQVFLAALIGLIPGCLGAFTIVSLYTHGLISLGAIVAAFSTTFGDEAFFMFSFIPDVTIYMSLILIVIATLTGWATNIIFKRKKLISMPNLHFDLHNIDLDKKTTDSSLIIPKIKNFTLPRFLLTVGLIIYIISLLSGEISHNHSPKFNNNKAKTEIEVHNHNEIINENSSSTIHSESEKHENHGFKWSGENILFLTLSLFTLFIVITVNNHFFKEHLWEHVIGKHFIKVFLWTFGALLLLGFLNSFVDIQKWIDSTQYAMLLLLLIAVIVGVIPESGPHYIFIILFINGTIPFSILLANSIVQDGHGALPLLAESKKSFLLIKGINVVVALLIGALGIFAGF